ncbi:hypothetical protein QEH59_11915 [Coraliomargarita sp. SDUM461004]|uniref:Glycosyltransferase RgtA/B/C/D-like domain-containing protein n=1 Tax=Thalassobacterium sedimentorum TaxID=3041258 RepID=A0ABU1AJZ3_9BACT|nr:hypothetical protein [Coraliomargarita sp. SDUM461004]MDQ8195135.1 hypothetical protein [Coraliomargarita sp. SDUM461004]
MSRLWKFLALAAVVYVLLFGLTFLADPLGQTPVLDARENVAWAQIIRAGQLPQEPIYRALLYPLILAQAPASFLPWAATCFGILLHLTSAVLVGLIAMQLWRDRGAAWSSGLLFAVYPVALYFSGQVLDITFSITLFLAAIYTLLRGMEASAACSQIAWGLAAGLFGGLAVLARPNFLPPALCLPVVILFAQTRSWRTPLCAGAGLLLMLCLQGWANQQLSGQFRLLPWQGAYNLYAANCEGANGKYYTQRVSFNEVPAGKNTTRMESEHFYREAFGADVDLEVDAMNAYWREQLRESVAADPWRWLGLMGRKGFYVFNNWEQYNNLSYHYHQARWPLLAWNPLGWGVLLLFAGAGLCFGYRNSDRPAFWGITILGLAYAAGLLLFFVSARFRLPLVPLLCVAAGGCVFLRRPQGRRDWSLATILLLCLGGLAFGNWFDARDRAPFIQDEVLLAKANSELGDDLQALALSRSVLARDPMRAEAQGLELTSLFNLWLLQREPIYWQDLAPALERVQSSDAAVEFIRGVFLWREAQPQQAIAIWQAAVRDFGAKARSSADALQAVGAAPPEAGRSQIVEQLRQILGV